MCLDSPEEENVFEKRPSMSLRFSRNKLNEGMGKTELLNCFIPTPLHTARDVVEVH
jgi:hypothetical protein